MFIIQLLYIFNRTEEKNGYIIHSILCIGLISCIVLSTLMIQLFYLQISYYFQLKILKSMKLIVFKIISWVKMKAREK